MARGGFKPSACKIETRQAIRLVFCLAYQAVAFFGRFTVLVGGGHGCTPSSAHKREQIGSSNPRNQEGSMIRGSSPARAALCDQSQRRNFVPCGVVFHRRGVDDGFKTIVAFPTAPKMAIFLLAPILGPFGGNKLVAALGAAHRKGRTTIGYHRRHGNLPVSLPPTSQRLSRRSTSRRVNYALDPKILYRTAVNSSAKGRIFTGLAADRFN